MEKSQKRSHHHTPPRIHFIGVQKIIPTLLSPHHHCSTVISSSSGSALEMQLFFKKTVLMPSNSTLLEQLKMHAGTKMKFCILPWSYTWHRHCVTMKTALLKSVRHALQEYLNCNVIQAHKTSTSDHSTVLSVMSWLCCASPHLYKVVAQVERGKF